MSKLKAVTFFSGIGGACIGIENAGYEVIWGNENDPYAGDVWAVNHPSAVLDRRSIMDVPLDEIPDADLYWFSPPCQEYSSSKIGGNGLTRDEDLTLALRICEIIKVKKPSRVVVENVARFAKSKAALLIESALSGGETSVQILNAKDYGTPQSRNRYILRYSRQGGIEDMPKHLTECWCMAILDLIPSLKPTSLTSAQLYALHKSGIPIEESTIVMERLGYYAKGVSFIYWFDPIWTIKAASHSDGKIKKNGYPTWRSAITIVQKGDPYTADRRCISRWFTFPDGFIWGPSEALNCRGLGNSVPCKFAEAIVRSFPIES